MPRSSALDTLFPPIGDVQVRRKSRQDNTTAHLYGRSGQSKLENIKTRWAAIYALELRGCTQAQIAEVVHMTPMSVGQVTRDPRYKQYREEHMAQLDHEFVEMKPMAFAALRGGLDSTDENTALRASEQWFKAAGFGGFAKNPEPTSPLTAEDIVSKLLNINVAVQVNVSKEEVE